jgi:hypothetical protein
VVLLDAFAQRFEVSWAVRRRREVHLDAGNTGIASGLTDKHIDVAVVIRFRLSIEGLWDVDYKFLSRRLRSSGYRQRGPDGYR